MKKYLAEDTLRWLAPGAILVLALGLRLWGIWWNLPYVDHPDEGVIVDHAIAFLKTGDLDPHFFNWPSLYMYLSAAVYWVHLLIGQSQDLYQSAQQWPDSTFVFTLVPQVYVWGRATTAVLGTLLVALTCIIGARYFNRWVGIVAGGIVAVSPLLVQNSHYITPDIPVAVFTTLTVLLAIEGALSSSMLPLVLSALVTGVAFSTKYNGGVAGAAVICAWLMRAFPAGLSMSRLERPAWFSPRRLAHPLVIAIPFVFVIGFVAFTPFSVLDWPKFSQDLFSQMSVYQQSKFVPRPDLPIWLNYVISLFERREWVVVLLSIGGAALAIWKRSRPGLVLVVFSVAYMVFFNQYRSFFLRNLVALVPPLAVLGAWFAVALVQWVGKARRQIGIAFASAAMIAMIGPGLFTSAAEDHYMAQTDTRTMATEWINAELSQGGRIAAELNPWQWQGVCRVLADGKPLNSRKLDWYAKNGYTHIVWSSNAHPKDRKAVKTFPKGLKLVAYFPGDDFGGMGPDIYVFDTGVTPTSLKIQNRVDKDFGGQIELLGFDAGPVETIDSRLDQSKSTGVPVTVKAGQFLGLNLYWQAEKDIGENWTVFVHLLNADGAVVAQRDTPPQDVSCLLPTSNWRQGQLVFGPFNTPIPANAPPGTYKVELGLYSPDTGERLPVSGSGGGTGAVILGEVTVK